MMQHPHKYLRRVAALSITLSLLASGFGCGDDDTVDADAGSDRDAGGEGDAGQEELDAGVDAGSAQMDAGDGMRAVSIRFKAKIGSRDLVCGENYSGLGTTGITATPQDLRFFVQEVRLLRKSDGAEVKVAFDTQAKFQNPDVALLDFTDGMGACAGSGGSVVNTTITGKVPEGDYDGIVFVNGVPEQLNHAGPAETAQAPLDDATLFWSWLSGYRFFVAELLPVTTHDAGAADGGAHVDGGAIHDAGATQGDASTAHDAGVMHGDAGATHDAGGGAGHGASEAAFLHVGSSACTGTQATMFTCARAARNEIKLTGFDPSKNYVVADLAEVFRESDLKTPPQCHGTAPECAAGYAALGIDMMTGEKTSTQRVFRVE